MGEPLLHRVAAGESKAIRECVSRYGGLIWSLARKMFHKKQDAEDAVQEVFILLWRKAGQYDSARASESTFVGVLARRRMIDILRQQKRGIQEVAEESFDIGTSDVDHLELSDEVAVLHESWKELPAEQQTVLSLSIYDGLSYSQISNHLNVPLGTVKTRARIGLKSLRARYRSPGSAETRLSIAPSKEMP